ncbi:MAG: ABC transporter ATP-binding protein [Methylobacterium sp.]|nr:ABC transporter ATP-binding protein [Methylobacterium sp.]MCA3651742.1 ABC transporter ATP-binding protein [Methylobacterium sp.]MCA4923681.1 ABC transporter ATP-binding protein [Methylobacterium sp.]
MSDAITVSGLDVRFGASHVVKDVRFTVGKGESYGIVGESGSGKSTILRALSGLNRDWGGSITIAGEPQKARRPPAFHRQVQMVFQDPFGSLHPRMTVDATLAEPVAIHGLGDADKRINRALADVGLDGGFRFRYPHQLSGGQRQRVAIARALILEPSILLLDEPTSALDVSIQAEVLNLLSDLKAARGLTLVLVSHNLAVVGHLCGRVAVMKEGRIVEEATLEAIRSGAIHQAYTRDLLAASRRAHGAITTA